jgi:hypothetical protein
MVASGGDRALPRRREGTALCRNRWLSTKLITYPSSPSNSGYTGVSCPHPPAYPRDTFDPIVIGTIRLLPHRSLTLQPTRQFPYLCRNRHRMNAGPLNVQLYTTSQPAFPHIACIAPLRSFTDCTHENRISRNPYSVVLATSCTNNFD